MGRERRWLGAPLVAVLIVAVAGAAVAVGRSSIGRPGCQPTLEHPDWSVARYWNEALLDAIRRDLPAPTVHARNLFHVSAAMWDAWAAFDPMAAGVYVGLGGLAAFA